MIDMVYKNKNLLPLLAITGILLSVGLVNFNNVSDSKILSTQSVLSESDDNKDEEKKDEQKKEDKNQEDKKDEEVSSKTIETKSKERIKNNEDEDEDDKDVDKKELKIESEFEQETESVLSDGTVNKFKLKFKQKTVNGKTIVETASGEVEVENSPDDAVNSLVEDGILDTPVSFEVKTNNNNKVEFEFQGVDAKKLLGLFELNLPKTVTVDSETGEVVDIKQTVWTKFLSLLSV